MEHDRDRALLSARSEGHDAQRPRVTEALPALDMTAQSQVIDPSPAPPGLDRALRSGPLPGAPRSAVEPVPGYTIKHYELIRQLGQGGMGTVFLARDTRLGRLVALKLLGEHRGTTRVLAEARATARCKHENIVVIHDVGEAGGHPYLVLEYIEGPTLRAWMRQRQGEAALPPPGVAIEHMVQVVRALACAHALGIVHRDLKPENIILSDSGPLKVLDFGIATLRETAGDAPLAAVAAPGTGRKPVTREDENIGTLPYMSPEQWLGEGIDHRSDLWAVGIMLHELVTGSHPLAPLTQERLRQVAVLDMPMPSLRDWRPDLGALAAIVDRCLEKHRDERVGSARELLDLLKALLPGHAMRLGADDSPFAGLAAFQEDQAGVFFGRDHDIASLIARLRNHSLVTVAGPSGAGKSSLVRAGLIPALKRSGDPWEAFVLRPGRRPLAGLADVLVQVADATDGETVGPDSLLATLCDRPGTLGARLRARCRRLDQRVLLFVDQLEELYTLEVDPAERAAFIACLEGAGDDASSPVRVVLAMRSDFIDRVADDRQLMAEVTRGLILLPPMSRDSLREALVRPVEAAGVHFESADMVEGMLDVLATTRGPLPLIQFTAARLWELRDDHRRLLTRASYEALGGVAGALSTHADAVLAGLGARERELARAVLLRLVTPERTRAVVSMDELGALAPEADGPLVLGVVERLADTRLVLIETGGDGATVELVHESLIERWPRLGQWLDDSAKDAAFLARVRAAAEQWQAGGHAEGLLWRDSAARDARRWLERLDEDADAPAGLSAREQRYLRAVVALAERTRRRRRRLAGGAFAVLAAIAVVVSYLAVRARQEAARAQDQAVRSRNATRMAAARERSADATTALALAREIEPPDVPRGWAEVVSAALHHGVAPVVLRHDSLVYGAQFNHDGSRIVTASADGTVRVWRADGTGEPVVLRGGKAVVATAAAFSPDGAHVVAALWDGTAWVWRADGTGEPIVLRGHETVVTSAAFSPDGTRIVTASADRTVKIWRADGTGEPLVLRGHESTVSSAAFSPDGTRVVTASEDRTVRIWRGDGTGEPLVLRGHESTVSSAEFSPDGVYVVTSSWDRTARVWRADGEGEPVVLRGHEDGLARAVFSPDGAYVVTASGDRTARVWRADGEGEPVVLRGHELGVESAAFSPDSTRIVTASIDYTARVWSREGASEPARLHVFPEPGLWSDLDPGEARMVIAGQDRSVRVWNADGTGEPIVFRGHDEELTHATFSPDGERVVSCSQDQTARVWRTDGTGEPVVLRGHEAAVTSAAFSPDGTRIVTASDDRTARVWRADGTGEPVVLRGHEAAVRSVAFSPDGTHVLTASGDRTARVWRVDGTGEPIVLRGHARGVASAMFSPDGSTIVTASSDSTARVWRADGTGEPVVLRGHEARLFSARFSLDGSKVVTTSPDGTARVWRADGTSEPVVLRGHEDAVFTGGFSPDGELVLTASYDGTARVWRADGSGQPWVLSGFDAPVWRGFFSQDGTRIVVRAGVSIEVWSVPEPLAGLDDPQLWTATNYCPPVELRMKLLGVSADMARADLDACQRRVDAARAYAARPQ